MRTIVTTCGMVLIIVIVSLINFNTESESLRQSEAITALKEAVEDALEVVSIKSMYTISDEQQLIDELLRNIALRINSNSNVTVKVLGVNLDEGMLDVLIKENFKYQTGKSGQVSYRTTIIIEED